MLIFSTKETPYLFKKDFEEIFGKAIELACQIVPNVGRDILEEFAESMSYIRNNIIVYLPKLFVLNIHY